MSVLKSRLHARMLEEQKEKMAGITERKKRSISGARYAPMSCILTSRSRITGPISNTPRCSPSSTGIWSLIESFLKQDSLEAVRSHG